MAPMNNNYDQRLLEGESQTLEFKTSFDKTTVESLVAFANAQGGTVLVGVNDAGVALGVSLGKETLNEWLGQIKSATSPSLIPDIVVHELNGKIIVSIQMAEFPVKPVNTRGRYYKRVASSNHQLSIGEIADLYMQSLQLSWDAHQAGKHTLDELSMPKIERFIRQVNENGRFALESTGLAALEKLNYIASGHPTWAAMLLFAKEPIRHNIHIGRFKTPSMIIDDRQFTDTLFEVVDQAMKFVVSYISVAFEFDGSIQRKERFAYPLPALREALLNAVVHRDYTDGSDIQIKIFDDHITIYSPGRLYGGLNLAELDSDNYKSRLRNKLVAEAFYLTGNIEKYGSGFIRIRKALRDYPELSLNTQEISGGIMLTFAQINIEQPESRPEKIDSAEQVTGQVTAEIVRLLNIVHGEMSRQQLQDALALKSRDNFDKRYLKPALLLSLIEPTMPDKPNSRHQKYRLTVAGQAQQLNQKAKHK
jgi:ATP-dependent DNA helicase RecG